jgi:hypothetical protein
MSIRRVRVREREPVLTALAVCFVSQARWYIVRYTARWVTPAGEVATETVRYPLTRQQLIVQSGGPELADLLTEHPDHWWRMPLPTRAEEDHDA